MFTRFVGAVTGGSVGYLVKFRSYEVREGSAFNCPIWQAVRATLALPNLFPMIEIGQELLKQRYIGGGIGWNNPSNEVINEFEAVWKGQNMACLASIGTGHEGVIQIDPSAILGNFHLALERMVTDCERIAQDIGHRFREQNTYFRFSVEHGLQHNDRSPITPGEMEAHTRAYLNSPGVTFSVDTLVASLIQAIEAPEYHATGDYFKQVLNHYILSAQERLNNITIMEIHLPAQEAVATLQSIQVGLQLLLLLLYRLTGDSLFLRTRNNGFPLQN